MAAPVVAAIAEPAVTADADQSVAPVAEASATLASTDASVSATAPADQADAAAEPPVVASASGLGSLGSLAFIAPIVGAVILAVAAFTLMRGRQAAPPAVFAGRDPWAKLANQARASAGA